MLYKKGTDSYIIHKIKCLMKALDYEIDNCDNYYGNQLYNIIRDYQSNRKLAVDGIIGKNTLSAIKKDINELLSDIIYYKHNNDVDISPPEYYDLNNVFGNPSFSPIGFESTYITKCNLMDLKEQYKHIINFHHRDWFGFRCHKYLLKIFHDIFQEIADRDLSNRIKTYDGCYNFRQIKNGHKLSTHSWGIAIDLNARIACYGCSPDKMDKDIVEIFEKYKFTWGGRWRHPDPMHFQFCKQ